MTPAAPGPPPAAGQAGSPGPAPQTPRPVPSRRVIIAALAVVMIAAGLLTYIVVRHRDHRTSRRHPGPQENGRVLVLAEERLKGRPSPLVRHLSGSVISLNRIPRPRPRGGNGR